MVVWWSRKVPRVGSWRPTSGLFTLALLWGVLAPAPILRDVSGFIGGNPAAALTVVWFLLTLGIAKQSSKALVIAAALIATGLIGVETSAASGLMRVWIGCLVVPLLMFAGLQLVDDKELSSARSATRFTLFVVVALSVFNYVREAGSGLLSPAFVFGHHDDLVLWATVGGDVLGNPNNASVIFCAGFAWAVGERALRKPGRLSLLFVVLSGLAIWSTGSRGAIAVGGLVVLVAVATKAGSRAKLLRVLVVGAVLFAGVNYWLTHIAPSTFHVANDESARLTARQETIPEVLHRPFGSGPGTVVDTLHVSLAPVFTGDSTAVTSHDLFLNWGVAVGWVGLLFLLVALWVGLRNGWRQAGILAVLPLLAFLLTAESAGIDALNPSNPAWSVMMWVLIGLAWRGGVLRRLEEGGAATPAQMPASAGARSHGALVPAEHRKTRPAPRR